MVGKEDLFSGVALGVGISLAIGGILSWILKPAFGSIIFILSLALLPGFFIMTLIYFYKIGKEKVKKEMASEKFDWGVEVNLRRLQILHGRYTAMLKSAAIVATGSFFAMVFIARDFPAWSTGHMVFFPISTVLFIFSIHFAFRWWFTMRQDYYHLMFKSR